MGEETKGIQELPLGAVTAAELMAREREALEAHPAGAYRQAPGEGLFGLAISGGGIRSATFALGALQELAQWGLIKRLHYLSTVSGGGYIGSWLMAWMQRYLAAHPWQAGDDTLKKFEKELAPRTTEDDPRAGSRTLRPEPDALRWLRSYGKYLAPNASLASADSWMIAAIWSRNALLNFLPLVLALGAVLLVPWWLSQLYMVSPTGWPEAGRLETWPLIARVAELVAPLVLFSFALRLTMAQGQREPEKRWRQGALVAGAMFCGACVTLVLALRGIPVEGRVLYVLGGVLALAGAWSGGRLVWMFLRVKTRGKVGWWRTRIAIGALFGAAGLPACLWLIAFASERMDQAGAAVLAPVVLPWVMAALFGKLVALLIGFGGRQMDELDREWWSRLGAQMTVFALGALALCTISVAGPVLMLILVGKLYYGIAAGTFWAAITAAGTWFANSSRSAGEDKSKPLTEKLLGLAPAVFLVGLLLLIAGGGFLVLDRLASGAWHWPEWPPAYECHGECEGQIAVRMERPFAEVAGTAWDFYRESCDRIQGSWWSLILALLSGGLFALFGRLFDVNEFSMHRFYRNRLVRAYQGASRGLREEDERQADPVSNFDDNDDLPVEELQPADGRPLPIYLVNTAVNLRGAAAPTKPGGEVSEGGLDERRAASFVFSPFGCGYQRLNHGEQRYRFYESERRLSYLPQRVREPLRLGTPVAASGAAASPNMGYHTSTAMAFLLTVFNVRLGYWIHNPSRRDGDWLAMGPRFGARCFLAELFGLADDSRKFVYLSDGGHFENLAVYELLRRRARYIICLDGEQDENYQYEGLSGLVRKARIDFQTEIVINTARIQPDEKTRLSGAHCACGTIHYPDAPAGTLLYIKASLTGDEPRDVLSYRQTHEAFPHETTGDQFFTESQFESYRRLGMHAVKNILDPDYDQDYDKPKPGGGRPSPLAGHTDVELAKLFAWLKGRWGGPRPPAEVQPAEAETL